MAPNGLGSVHDKKSTIVCVDEESDTKSDIVEISSDSDNDAMSTTDSDTDPSSVELIEPSRVEKKSYKKTGELTRRLKLAEKRKADKRARHKERREARRRANEAKPRKKVPIVPSVTDAIKDEVYIPPDPATLERLIMKTTNPKTTEDNKCPDKEREITLRIRRRALEGAGLMLDPADEIKVQIYVDFEKQKCRNLNDPQEVLECVYPALFVRVQRRMYANPRGMPADGMARAGFVVRTESSGPEDVFEDAMTAVDYLRRSKEFKDMDYPIGFQNVMLTLVHRGFPKNGAVPSSVGIGLLLYEQ